MEPQRSIQQESFERTAESGQEIGLQLRSAAERGRLLDVRKLLSCGAPVLKDSNGLNALHKAAKNGHSAVIKHLMGCRRFTVNQQDKYGWTPLHWAAWNGHVNAISTLVSSSRLNSNLTDKSGSSALHCAALNGHSDGIRLLATTAKVDVNLQRRDGWTALHLACWNGHQETVHELLTVQCKVNVRTESGMGPLHLVAAKGYDAIAKDLLGAGVAPDMQDKLGNTALHEAVKWSHLTTVRILKQAGCRANMKNTDGDTPIDIAHREGQADMEIELLRYCRQSSCSLNNSYNSDDMKKMMLYHCGSLCNPSELADLKPFVDDEKMLSGSFDGPKDFQYAGIMSPFREYTSRSSFDSITSEESTISKASSKNSKKQNSLESDDKSWQEKLENARAEMVATYKSRIAEVEKEYQQKVFSLEKQCLQRPSVMRRVYSDSPSQQQLLSVPPRPFFASSANLANHVHTI